ncbi:hypothetical protein [Herpetosiphon llansteffanensis]|uniref:hypothetical protein n=1 Tax=Herpetosiphon llansteffanensis TaxID=2094568 RepID=UPI000D7CF8C4|nr:hypothetical protein [Herpetosiphon llansteffanensis]
MLDVDTYAGLMRYFQSMQAINPLDPRWESGIASLETWNTLNQSTPVNQTALLALIQTIHTYKDQGSGWFALALFINNWLNQHHINAPTIFEWNPRN